MFVMNVVEKRQFERYAIELKATLTLGENVFKTIIFNLSAGGAKVALQSADVSLGDVVGRDVVLDIGGFGGFEGQFVWHEGEFFGIEFNESHKTIVNLVLGSVPV